MKTILVTGGDGRFANVLKKINSKYNFIFTNKNKLDINNCKSIRNNLNLYKPYAVLHLAGLSRPLDLHNKSITKSITLNIIGTSNLVNECSKKNTKLIYFSTSYVYQGTKGGYKEIDPVLPWIN